MPIETPEPRALSAALSAPTPFATRGGGSMLHAANRHVERWAPEATAANVRSMRSLGFVDRLVAPWIETAQRSASMRLFSQYSTAGAAQREGAAVSWVFPRPWYQDELDWMAAARQIKAKTGEGASPTMLTTRGTFVAPQPPPEQQRPAIAAPQTAMPSALYEYVAPSLSIAQPTPQSSIAGIGYAGADAGRPLDAYSTLIPLAAVQAAELMSRAVAPLMRAPASPDGAVATPSTIGRVSPALRAVLTTMLERATMQRSDARVAQQAPELVTPPAPRPDPVSVPATQASAGAELSSDASRLADHYAGQRAQIADLQRIARVSAERELALRADAQAHEASITGSVSARTQAPSAEPAKAAAAAEIQQRTTAMTDAQAAAASEAQRMAAATEAQRAAAAERARIEERIAQRITERTGAEQVRTGQQRLHEQARIEAAQHARTSDELLAASSAAPTTPTAPAVDPRRAPAEVMAAIAALPAELQQILAQRPERGMAAIAELADVLRAAELMARSTHGNQPFEVTRGPRLMMPAGLGGLVSAVERAHVIAPAQLSSTMAAPSQMTQISGMSAPRTTQIVPRMPSLPWLAGPATTPRAGAAPSTALGATAAAQPAALAHVAWSDRWLARFAGAAPRSLEILQASAGGTREQRMQALASAAPESVFVRPMFDVDAMPRPAMPIEAVPSFTATGTPGAAPVPTPVLRPSPQPIERFDDDAETPDAVFAQIAAAAAGVRTAAAAQSAAPAPATTAAATPMVHDPGRMTQADAVAQGAPSAPNAGLSAGLAASPFAPALRHLLPLPAAASFDVRALFGGGLSATYLAGLLTPDAREIGVDAGGIGAPAWASFAPAGTQAAELLSNERAVPELDLSYVAPERAAAPADDLPSIGEVPSSTSAPALPTFDTRTAEAAVLASYAAPLTTLRTALLSWSVDPTAPSLAESPTVTAGQAVSITSTAARAMSQSMSMPMLGDAMPALDGGSAWTAPGMVGERAQSWSVAQERSSSDLSLDFVAPELVLAARLYGLGPAEAAQASRLALAGPSQLSAMASTVDRTFVQALSIASERRFAGQLVGQPGASAPAFAGAPASAAPAGPGAIATAYPIAPAASAGTLESDRAAGVGSAPLDHMLPTSAFGVERRTPRGAFLWPAASVAALGLNAAAHDGEQSMSVAALELLAAQAVAEIGTYAAFADRGMSASSATASSSATDGEDGATAASRGVAASGSAAASLVGGTSATMPSLAEPGETEVLGAAAALVSTSRRARFDALYVALSQSPSGRNWSPAARAARALALAGRGDEAPISAYERAATAWDVLPVVYATDGMSIAEIDAATATGALPTIARSAAGAQRGGRAAAAPSMPALSTSGRSGMTPLISRAGEALGSYVAPSTGDLAAAALRSEKSSSRELPVAQRAPTAAQELVQTGRPAGRYGGGEVEIPAWFESAARKMFDERSSSAGSSDMGFSMSELTLVSAAPASQIAASTKAPHTASVAPASAGAKDKGQAGGAIDIDKIANDVYREIMVMMDTARSRNGEPYL